MNCQLVAVYLDNISTILKFVRKAN